ncbi:non-ribosomal peptide synthetase, partial [Kitasatospora nipponensis]|uniref:non-ribosomal peptide synthetase n=1 Tax=Kitasatospora nipponensis TaxID=258049 RepID=UPI0031D43586
QHLPLLTDHEHHRVTVEFNTTHRPYDLDTPVHHLFEQQAHRTPHRPATTDQHTTLTYAQLNTRANTLAHTLRTHHHIQPGTLIALHLHRSTDLMTAILGTLKAGAAYLPINPDDPTERLHTILHDSGTHLLITNGTTPPPHPDITTIDLTTLDLTTHPHNPTPLAGPHDPAYCIYTSGSTGKPKGVLVEHRSILNRLRWMIDDLDLDQDDVILQKTPYIFDVSLWELLVPGIIGAHQIMLRPGGQNDPHAIADAIRRHGVTTLHFVPPMLTHYLATVTDAFPGVRHCICSGEELTADLATRFHTATHGTPTRLHNYYGPTEAAVEVTAVEVQRGAPSVTIGRPVANCRIYVLDAQDQPAPIGVTGELCIGGVQVARGYLNRPDLTTQRFTPDPYHPHHRIYRTGDLARWHPDGQLTYHGRADRQIKIRGHRIELGEIEHALHTHPTIHQAIVIPQHHPTGHTYLVAYLHTKPHTNPTPQQLRDTLATQLPDHMIPTHYVTTDHIPVTPSGKIDRTALTNLTTAQTAATHEHVPPRTPLETELHTIWQTLLPTTQLGTTDDFFTIGGHSLTALQLTSRINQSHGTHLTITNVFHHRTITEQARLIEQTTTDR